ncbi:putative adhesin [Polyangium mundeleinium]|uniref:Putative adhesin Stv domain-containing protein n=1 Tax=Polyangium mundeleinium TaxID=2995306 RepID=A0ABT5F9P3_9BACT|nr:hypothetical protein [Polyangium mundeleinium]MDC0749892.1 hypothetical protein [Polyangium mundeleinium]
MKIEIEPRLYFFRSVYEIEKQTPVTDCLTLSHGATYENSGYFTVPQGVTIHFFTSPGVPLPGSVTDLILRDSHLVYEDVKEGKQCPNYVLSKVVNTKAAPEDYLGIDGLMHSAYEGVKRFGYRQKDKRDKDWNDNGTWAGTNVVRWAPHVVTVRSRSIFTGYLKVISLREVLEIVLNKYRYITDFYVAACRVHAVSTLLGHKTVAPALAPKPY